MKIIDANNGIVVLNILEGLVKFDNFVTSRGLTTTSSSTTNQPSNLNDLAIGCKQRGKCSVSLDTSVSLFRWGIMIIMKK